jgi:hypothetical protein
VRKVLVQDPSTPGGWAERWDINGSGDASSQAPIAGADAAAGLPSRDVNALQMKVGADAAEQLVLRMAKVMDAYRHTADRIIANINDSALPAQSRG